MSSFLSDERLSEGQEIQVLGADLGFMKALAFDIQIPTQQLYLKSIVLQPAKELEAAMTVFLKTESYCVSLLGWSRT